MRLFGIGVERERHFTAGARRLVGGENNFEDRSTVLAGDQWFFVILHAVNKMRHLLMETVVPFLLENCECPDFGRAGFLDSVVVAVGIVGLDDVAIEQISVSDSF